MINKLILGTVQLGLEYGINNNEGKPSLQKSLNILNTAFDNGIGFLDTAESYGNSQEIIGEFHKQHPKKTFNVITKTTGDNLLNNEEVQKRISENLKVLNVNELYGYMFHNYESFNKSTHLLKELSLIKCQGKIKYLGISLYKNEELEDVITNYNDFDFIQIPFNLLDNATKRKSILERAKEKGIQIHTRSVFLQGLFFKESENLHNKIKELSHYLEKLSTIKDNCKISIEELAMQYVLQKKYIDNVLVGVDNPQQLINNIKLSEKQTQIPHDIIDKINVKNENLLNPANWN